MFSIACEMLRATNPFSKDVSELRYSLRGQEDDTRYNLLDLVETEIKKYNHRHKGKSEENLKRVYDAISKAMVKYVENYPVTFSFKQQTKRNFKGWLKKLGEACEIEDPPIPEIFEVKEADTGIALLKLLHSRAGVSYEDIGNAMGFTQRAIQKDLIKLCPSMYSGPTTAASYVPFKIGGQPIVADISLVDSNVERADEKRFFTRNTIHPLVLQENIVQLASLLKALCYQYFDCSDEVAVLIAIDIWSQMSEYARKKIKNHYAFDNPDLTDFVKMLEDECPDDHVCKYRTERELSEEIEMPIDDALRYLAKAPGRKATILLKNGVHLRVRELHQTYNAEGCPAYKALTVGGGETTFTKDQVEEVLHK